MEGNMRITFNPAISSAGPIRPIQRVVRKNASVTAEPVELEPAISAPVTTSLSELGVQLSRNETVAEQNYREKDPLWNMMLNL